MIENPTDKRLNILNNLFNYFDKEIFEGIILDPVPVMYVERIASRAIIFDQKGNIVLTFAEIKRLLTV